MWSLDREEYGKTYAAETTGIDVPLPERSEYRLTHMPYFAMAGYARLFRQFDPHRKTRGDAAPKDAGYIRFSKF